MATSYQDNDSSLEKLEEEYRRQVQLVDHIRGLLTRADARRTAEPENYRKWNRVLDNLETALIEAKNKLQRFEANLDNERRWQQTVGEAPVVPDAPVPCSDPEPATLLIDAAPDSELAADAARGLLEAPLDTVEKAPLEQVALAQRYLAWRAERGVSNGVDKRLAGRVELAIQGRGGTQQKPVVGRTAQERRQQRALREIVAKIQHNRLDALSLQDIDLAMECYTVLTQRVDIEPSEARLKDILLRGLREVDRVLERIRQRLVS
jgi:hypothetical protein